MNEDIVRELRKTVERAVRPLAVSLKRKRQVREELLAHLLGVFDQELATDGDEQAALARTLARFGDPAELTADLANSAPRLDGLQRFLEWAGGPPTTTRAAICRSLILAVQVFLLQGVLIACLVPALLMLKTQAQFRYGMAAIFYSTATSAVFLPILIFSAYLMRRAFFDPERGAGQTDAGMKAGARFVAGCSAVLLATLLAPAIGALGYGLIAGDFPAVADQTLRFVALGLATGICATLIGYAEQQEMLREDPWRDVLIEG